MAALQLCVAVEQVELAAPFRISGFVFERQDIVVVTLRDGSHQGRGEAAGVYYLKDDSQNIVATLEAHRAQIERGIDRESLQQLLPPGERATPSIAHCGSSMQPAPDEWSGSSRACARSILW